MDMDMAMAHRAARQKKRAEHWEAVADVRLSPSHLLGPPPQDIALGARLLARQLLCAHGPHPR